MTQYSRGRSVEYKVRNRFVEAGYSYMRSAGSHGAADLLVGRRDLYPYAIQVKRGSHKMKSSELSDLVEFAKAFHAIPIVVFYVKHKLSFYGISKSKPYHIIPGVVVL